MQTSQKPEAPERQIPAEPRFTREAPPEIEAPPIATGSSLLLLMGGLALALVVLVAIIFAATGGQSGGGTAAPAAAPAKRTAAAPAPAPSAHIAITLKEFTITPAPAVGRAGRVTFRVHNAGAMRHEFVVLRTNKA